jgi:hypothetical protein
MSTHCLGALFARLRRLTPSLFLAVALCCFSTISLAQSESGSAAVEGVVVSQDGNPVAGATVVVRSRETGYVRTVTTDANGRYFAGVMPVGVYQIEATAMSFAPGVNEAVRLTVGNTERANLTLSVTTGSETVDISADAGGIDVQESAAGLNIDERAIKDLPIRGRNFAEFFQLQPSIVQEQDRSGLVVAGQRSINSNVAIDGADFNDPLQGNQRGGNESVFFFPQSAVREFQVVRAGASAEIGRTNAGFLNVVTKSGTNDFHGEGFYFNRNKKFTSPDAFGRSLDNRQNQFGGNFGGPLKRDKAFFFVAVEQNFLRVPFVVQFQRPSGLPAIPPDILNLEGERRGTNNPTALFARTDFNLTPNHTLNIQYNFTRLNGENFDFEAARQDRAESVNFARENFSNGVKGSLTSVFSTGLVNEIRAQVANDNRDEAPNFTGPQIDVNGFGTLGGDNSRPRKFDTTRYQLTDNVSYNRGRHQLRFGFDLNVNRVSQQRAAGIQGRYGFTGNTAFQRFLNTRNGMNQLNRYRGFLPGTPQDPATFEGTINEVAFFINDKIALHPHVTLTAGFRMESQFNPLVSSPNPDISETTRIPDDLKQAQPRLGLAWNVGGKGTTVVRATAGLFTARTPATLFQRVFTENGLRNLTIDTNQLSGARRTAFLNAIFPQFPNVITTLPAGFSPADFPQRVYGFAPDFQNPRSFQTSLTVEQAIGDKWTLTLGYIRNSTWDLQRRVNRNLPRPTFSAVGGYPVFDLARRPIQVLNGVNYGPILINESSSHSTYDGGTLTVTRRFANRYQLQGSYTYSKTLDDDSNERNFNQEFSLNPFDLRQERGPSKQDVRHNFNVSGLVDLPYGFTVSAIAITRSGFPFTAIVGDDINNDGNDNDRAVIGGVVVPRNSFRQPKFFNLDVRLVKHFKMGETRRLDLSVEAFNLTRNTNRGFGVDGIATVGGPTPGSPNAGFISGSMEPFSAPSTARFGGPRQVQIGARFTF